MKKVIFALVAMMFATSSFAQLTISTANEKYEKMSVYDWGGTISSPYPGHIAYIDSTYILFAKSDNQFEHDYHSIILGHTKDEAIASMQQLATLMKTMKYKDQLDVLGVNGKTTRLWQSRGALFIMTEGVAGKGLCLYYLKVEKAIQAIIDYNESL